ncbi:hypothetical protein NKG94_39950 [Micromonospora sp. M12]
MAAVVALGWLTRRSGRASTGRLAAGFGLALVPIVAAPVAAQLLWLAITTIRPGYAELLDPYRPIWYRLAVLALATAILFTWYALTRRRIGPAALAVGGLAWLALLGVLLAVAVPGGRTSPHCRRWPAPSAARRAAYPAERAVAGGGGDGRRGRRCGHPAAHGGAALPRAGDGHGRVAALVAVLLGLTALPVVDLLHPRPAGSAACGRCGPDDSRCCRPVPPPWRRWCSPGSGWASTASTPPIPCRPT